jgi:hypothetical protein
MSNKIFHSFLFLFISLASFSQNATEKVTEIETLPNGIVVYQAKGVEKNSNTVSTSGVSHPIKREFEDWSLNECEIALRQVQEKIQASKDNSQNTTQLDVYYSAEKRLIDRIEILKKK